MHITIALRSDWMLVPFQIMAALGIYLVYLSGREGVVMMPPCNLLQSQWHMCLYVAKVQKFHLWKEK